MASASTTVTTTSGPQDKDHIVDNILRLAQKEQLSGNKSITQDKLDNLSRYVLAQKSKRETQRTNLKTRADAKQSTDLTESIDSLHKKPLPIPQYSSLFTKFDIHNNKSSISSIPRTKIPQPQQQDVSSSGQSSKRSSRPKRKVTFKTAERVVIEVLEAIANILDNLHLFSKLPMFPNSLLNLLKQTNKLWILILVFLIRKTISQLLNVIRKQKKVESELKIVRQNGSKLLEVDDPAGESIFKKYEKVLKDLKFDRTMLVIELIGNFLDLAFNVIEFYGFGVPDWFMSGLNAASMFMTIYRMNKDDEYVDDDITEDLL